MYFFLYVVVAGVGAASTYSVDSVASSAVTSTSSLASFTSVGVVFTSLIVNATGVGIQFTHLLFSFFFSLSAFENSLYSNVALV